MRRSLILPLVSTLFLLFAARHVLSRQRPSEQAAPPVPPAHAPYERQVAGAGLVEARTENLKIGSPLAGIVDRVHVRAGQTVRPGDPLFTLDSRQIRAGVQAGEARLQAAEAELAKLDQMPRPEDVPPVEARRREADAQLSEAKDLLDRTQRLREKGVATDEQLIGRRMQFDAALARLDSAKAEEARTRAGAWDADKRIARAAVERARAELQQQQTELIRHTILTPEASGEGRGAELMVLQVNVRPGEAVAMESSNALVVLGNLTCKHLRVDIDEHDIPRYESDASAVACVRGESSDRYSLEFVRLEPYVIPKRSLTGDNTERVDTRVLQAIYRIDESGRKPIFVGQQMDVFIELEPHPEK